VADINSVRYIGSKDGASGFGNAKTELMTDGATELMTGDYTQPKSTGKAKKVALACAGVLCVGAVAAAVAVNHNSKSVTDTRSTTELNSEINTEITTEVNTEISTEITTYSPEVNAAARQCFTKLASTESGDYRYLYYDVDKDGVDEFLVDSLQYDTKYLNFRVYKYAQTVDSTNFLGAIGCGFSNINAVALYEYDGNGIVAHGYDATDSNSVVTMLFSVDGRDISTTELLKKTTLQDGTTEYYSNGEAVDEETYNTSLAELTKAKRSYEQVETTTVTTTVEPTTVQTTQAPVQKTQPVTQAQKTQTTQSTTKATQPTTKAAQPVTQAPVQQTQPTTKAAQPTTQAPVQQTQPAEQSNTSSNESDNTGLPPIVMGFD
jgi:hypothetical protein